MFIRHTQDARRAIFEYKQRACARLILIEKEMRAAAWKPKRCCHLPCNLSTSRAVSMANRTRALHWCGVYTTNPNAVEWKTRRFAWLACGTHAERRPKQMDDQLLHRAHYIPRPSSSALPSQTQSTQSALVECILCEAALSAAPHK